MEPVNPLGAEARAALSAYRREVPSAAAMRSDWARVTAAIEPSSAEDDDVIEPAATGGRGSMGRWAIAAGLAVAIAAVVLLALRGVVSAATALGMGASAPMEAVDHAEGERVRTAKTSSASTRTAAPSSADARTEAEAVAIDPHAAVPTDGGRGIPAAPARSTAPSAAAESSASPAETSEQDAARLAQETSLLRDVREALAAGDPKSALRSIALHEERFPEGALVEERMLYRAIARCRSTGPDPAEADAFLRSFPTSPHAPRVRAECGGSR